MKSNFSPLIRAICQKANITKSVIMRVRLSIFEYRAMLLNIALKFWKIQMAKNLLLLFQIMPLVPYNMEKILKRTQFIYHNFNSYLIIVLMIISISNSISLSALDPYRISIKKLIFCLKNLINLLKTNLLTVPYYM